MADHMGVSKQTLAIRLRFNILPILFFPILDATPEVTVRHIDVKEFPEAVNVAFIGTAEFSGGAATYGPFIEPHLHNERSHNSQGVNCGSFAGKWNY